MDPFQELYWINVCQSVYFLIFISMLCFACTFIVTLAGCMVVTAPGRKAVMCTWVSGLIMMVLMIALCFMPKPELLKMRHAICVQKIEQLKATTVIVKQE